MQYQGSDQKQSRNHKKSPHSRGNFSKCGKLCDQNFYLQGVDIDTTRRVDIQVVPKRSPRQSTTAFTSVPRDVQQNLRFSIPLPVGEFSHKPDHLYGRSKSPTWSFPKKQRYGTEKIQEFQICKRHPITKNQQQIMYKSTSSIKEVVKSKGTLFKSASMLNETMDQTRNYSIIMPRKTSAVQFFSKTKIKNPFYLSRAEIMNEQEKLEGNKAIEPCPKGYIEFYKKRARHPNRNSKGFETFLQSYKHENHFNNFSLTQHPTSPHHHINFDKHLDRNLEPRSTQCPNFQQSKIDFARVNRKNIDLNLSKFRAKIITKYDRAQPLPNTRLDYDPPANNLGGMVTMGKVIGRPHQLFPIVDPAIKKAGDKQARQKLRQEIPVKQINEAMRPKCNVKIEI